MKTFYSTVMFSFERSSPWKVYLTYQLSHLRFSQPLPMDRLFPYTGRRIYLRNVRYGVTKDCLRALILRLGVVSCSGIQLVRKDTWWIPEHCSAYLYIEDVSGLSSGFIFGGNGLLSMSYLFWCTHCLRLQISTSFWEHWMAYSIHRSAVGDWG